MALIIKTGQIFKEKLSFSSNGLIYKISNVKNNACYYIRPDGKEGFFGSLNDDGTAPWESNWDLISEEGNAELKSVQAINTAGCYCALCRDYASYASPNRPDGKTFICWSCSKGWIPAGL